MSLAQPSPHPLVERAARVARTASRRLGLGGGTSIPGTILERFDPGFVARRAAWLRDGSVAVSGTNGKTTTSSMIRSVLDVADIVTASNDAGANMLRGVATALLEMPDDATMGVFEIDEGWLPRTAAALRPRVVVLTNVFRDQLDRFGEAESVASLFANALRRLPSDVCVVANADDPLLWETVKPYDPIGVGVRPLETGTDEDDNRADAEPETCPRCGAQLSYAWRTIAHLGAAHCPVCSWAWTEPRHLLRVTASDGLRSIELDGAGERLTLRVGGMHNAYNAAAALAVADCLGISGRTARDALAAFTPRFGRSERLDVDGRPVRLVLTKNPAGTSIVIREIAADPDVGAVVVSVSDQTADGRDISWIWDADHERLAATGLPLVPGGRRAADVAVRLKYAGAVPRPPQPDPLAAIREAIRACPPGKSVAVLATYTAMLDVRRALGRSGPARLADAVPA